MSKFTVTPLELDGVLLVVPRRFADRRGFVAEIYRADAFRSFGIEAAFVQDNQSFSAAAGTVRGLHFQAPPAPQAKLVRAIRGAVLDIAVDIRRGSPTYGCWCGATLTAAKGEQLFIPRGFAHGFCTLEPDTEIAYKIDGFYAPECEGGVIWNDPEIGIVWPVVPGQAILSERDLNLPRLRELDSPFSLGGR
jgi:dTDP-4-dehydrorhamnose 3,5-epimerase